MQRMSLLRMGLICLGIAALSPAVANATKFAGEFMNNGAGARALGMGGAFCAVADDATAVYYNPGGISGFEKRQALFMHSEQFGDQLNYNFASYVMPTTLFAGASRKPAMGFALIHLGAPDQIVTNGLDWQEVNGVPGFQPESGDQLLFDASALPRESSNDFALYGSFAMGTSLGRVGATLKLIYIDQITDVTATGIGLDLGFLRHDLFVDNLDFGATLRDITGTYISWSTGKNEFITPSVRLGVAYTVTSETLRGSLLLSADSEVFFDDRQIAAQYWQGAFGTDLHFGAEARFQEKVMVRGGFDRSNPTVGAGFRIGMLGFDYAYLHERDADDDAPLLEDSHRISGYVDF